MNSHQRRSRNLSAKFAVHRDSVDVNLAVIQEAFRGVRVRMKIPDPEARLLRFVIEIFSRLERFRYGMFKKMNKEKQLNESKNSSIRLL